MVGSHGVFEDLGEGRGTRPRRSSGEWERSSPERTDGGTSAVIGRRGKGDVNVGPS